MIDRETLKNYSLDEQAEMIILDQYKENMISEPMLTVSFTKQIVQAGGRDLTPILMMAKVNAAVAYRCANR